MDKGEKQERMDGRREAGVSRASGGSGRGRVSGGNIEASLWRAWFCSITCRRAPYFLGSYYLCFQVGCLYN